MHLKILHMIPKMLRLQLKYICSIYLLSLSIRIEFLTSHILILIKLQMPHAYLLCPCTLLMVSSFPYLLLTCSFTQSVNDQVFRCSNYPSIPTFTLPVTSSIPYFILTFSFLSSQLALSLLLNPFTADFVSPAKLNNANSNP